MSNERTKVRSFFHSIQIRLSDAWLESCVNWCRNEVLGPNYTLEELQSKVYEQWLLSDLRDAEVPCLPPNLSTQKHFILNGDFCLQMIHVMDISKPKLWQLQKIRNNLTKSAQDSDTVGTGKRMLQLLLTDGVQEVEAMEFKPISSLSINLKPGVKIRITGPVVVRRGRLMLEQQNVKILGGEAEELLVSHAAENVLARVLKLPENPNPTRIEEKLLITEKEEENIGYSRITELPKPEITPMVIDQDPEAEEIEEIMLQAERNLRGSNDDSKTPDLFEDDDFNPEDFDRLDQFASTSTQAVHNKPKPLQRNKLPSFDDDDGVFDDIDVDAHLDQVLSNKENQIITIVKLLEETKNNGEFKIKAKFKSVVEKLTVGEKEYKLVIKIEDETGDLVVKVHSDLISEFAGYDPEGIQRLKSCVLGNQGNAVEKVMEAIQKVKDKLVKLDNIMIVNLTANQVPVITKIL